MAPTRHTHMPHNTDRPRRPWRRLGSTVLGVPLFAIPFALFFLLVTGHGWRDLAAFYRVSLVFTICTMLSAWFTDCWLLHWLARPGSPDPSARLQSAGVHLVMALLSSAVAVVILGATFLPGLLTSLRSLLTIAAFGLIFGSLFLSVSLARNFYRTAVVRAASDRELLVARQIQRSFLLDQFPAPGGVNVHARNLPSREVSGDFYDVVPAGPGTFVVAIADVSGKGVPAALLSAMLQASLRTQAGPNLSPAAVMAILNRLTCDRPTTSQFATFFLSVLDEASLTLRFTNAGHNHPLLMRASGECEHLERGGIAVGMFEGSRYEEGVVGLRPGDRLLLYTDGVTEATRADGEMFGDDRLLDLFRAAPPAATAEALVDHVLGGVRRFLGDTEASDDVTVMAMVVGQPAEAARKAE
jgi:serine phosphatase RsbU (regulator of sigma subunit)